MCYLKGAAEAVFSELKQNADQSGTPFPAVIAQYIKSKYPQGAFRDDNWFLRQVPLNACYFAHTDFRGYAVPKNQPFIDFMANKHGEIEAGTFPCSAEIRAQWSGPMPQPLVQERGVERYYILDGQLRVTRCRMLIGPWHTNPSILRIADNLPVQKIQVSSMETNAPGQNVAEAVEDGFYRRLLDQRGGQIEQRSIPAIGRG